MDEETIRNLTGVFYREEEIPELVPETVQQANESGL